jgi:exportin-2 (importin alpha re-exporter)
MMGIAIRKESAQGVTEVNSAVNVVEFFQNNILPELQDTNHSNRPVVKATALKFVSTFRNQFSREHLIQLLPMSIQHLASPVIVVHTFAAYSIERVLVSKVNTNGLMRPKIGAAELLPVMEPLFQGLFRIIDNEEWNENDYVMKCVMRSLSSAGESVIPVTEIVITKLTGALGRIAKNPRNPQFNHCLFESIAILIRSALSKDPNQGELFERLLFVPFTTILTMEIVEFTPYVFQLLAQLLEFRPAGSGLGMSYQNLFQPILTPDLWEQKGNVPALARLMQAYIKKAAPELTPHISPILGVWQKLIASKATEASAFDILSAIVVFFPPETLQTALSTIFQILLTRLQGSMQQVRFKRLVTNFFALYVGKFGSQAFIEPLNAKQAGLGFNILNQVWLPRLVSDPPTQRTEAKTQITGLTKFITETPALLADDTGRQIWGLALKGAVTVLASPSLKITPDLSLEDDMEVEITYDATFSRLHYAYKPIDEYFPEVADPSATFVQSLQRLCASKPPIIGLIQQSLGGDPKLQLSFESMCAQAGVQLV